VFSPSEDELSGARRIIEAMAKAQQDGRGAVSLDGRLIDIASIKMAENLLAKAGQPAEPLHALHEGSVKSL
jgi:malyl-CoA/(S)-citramalyl-CoA lyase